MTTSPDDPTRRPAWRTALLAVGALTVGVALGATAAWAATDQPESSGTEPDRDAAATALLDAMARSNDATYTAEGTFRREVDGDMVVDDEMVVVQRRPDRLTLGFGSWDGVVAGQRVACRRDGRHGAFVDCDRLGPGDLDEIDDARGAELAGLVEGIGPTYRVTELADLCFRLVLDAAVRFEPSYGQRTDLCFDEATGAEVRRRIERENSVDDTVLEVRSADVDDADLAVPN